MLWHFATPDHFCTSHSEKDWENLLYLAISQAPPLSFEHRHSGRHLHPSATKEKMKIIRERTGNQHTMHQICIYVDGGVFYGLSHRWKNLYEDFKGIELTFQSENPDDIERRLSSK